MSRRGFIETAGAATGAMMAAGAFPHPAVGQREGGQRKDQHRDPRPGRPRPGTSSHPSEDEKQGAKAGRHHRPLRRVGRQQGGRARPVLLRRKMRARLGGQRQGPRHQGLPQDPRQQGCRRRPDRHPRPLARQDVDRRHGGRQGRLLRKADDPHDRRGPQGRRDDQEDQAGLHRGRPVDRRSALADGQPDDHRGQDRPRHAGPDQLLPQQRRRPVAVLQAHART